MKTSYRYTINQAITEVLYEKGLGGTESGCSKLAHEIEQSIKTMARVHQGNVNYHNAYHGITMAAIGMAKMTIMRTDLTDAMKLISIQTILDRCSDEIDEATETHLPDYWKALCKLNGDVDSDLRG